MTDALVIDAEGLDTLSCNAKANPETGKKTLKAKTVCEAGFRNMTYVRDLAPMLAGAADDATLKEIHDNAVAWSPVVNTFRNPVSVDSTLAIGKETATGSQQ